MTDSHFTLEIPRSLGIQCWIDPEDGMFVISQYVDGEERVIALGQYEVQELCRHLPSALVAMRAA